MPWRFNDSDRQLLLKFNAMLLKHAAAMERAKPKTVLEALASLPAQIFRHQDVRELHALDPEAHQVFDLARRAPATPKALYKLFDEFVRDSMAGFNQALVEGTGYWRYRKGYLGRGTPLITSNDAQAEKVSNST